MKSNSKSSATCSKSNQTLLQCQDPLWVELYLFHRYLGVGAIWRNWARILQITCWDTRKIIQSLQILILHQMRPYSSFKTLCGLSYTCFTGTQVLGKFGETWPKYPKSYTGTHENQSKVFSSTFHVKLAFTLVSKPLRVGLYLFYRYLGIRVIWGNWPQIPKIMCRDTQKVIQSFQHYV